MMMMMMMMMMMKQLSGCILYKTVLKSEFVLLTLREFQKHN